MQVPRHIADAARARIDAADPKIQGTLDQIQKGTPLRAETERDRATDRVAVVADVDRTTAARIVNYEDPAALGLRGESLRKAEALQGKTVDYVGVGWLEAGKIAANSVSRIIFRNGSARGTGFLVSDRLLLTNNHVIPDADTARRLIAEFRYEIPFGQSTASPIRFEFDPDTLFITDEIDDLDFTLVAIGRAQTTGAHLAEFGSCPLSDSAAKHSVGEPVNVVQHPDGDYKQVVVRESRILHRGDSVLHYLADTEAGSSGSPVFNDEWQVVALHHWGGPHRQQTLNGQPLRTDVNEGIRISAIVAELRSRTGGLTASQQGMVSAALNAPSPGNFGTRVVQLASSGPQRIFPPAPVEPLPIGPVVAANEAGGGAPANRIDRDYSNRRGYNERFLRDFPIPLPQLTSAQRRVAARVRGIGESANPYELKYQHFSVVLNAERRMAFFSACNIDGSKRIRVDRDTGRAVSAPEATETWAIDPRVPVEAQLDDAFYARVRRDLRTSADFFARGHLTRREDPNWGRDDFAERANDDTFHHPNACPQVNNAFNSSQRAWQGIENYVLNAADDSNLRVTVITGPVFGSDDPLYDDEEFGGLRFPRRFWKIVARVEDGQPLVFAILADQSEGMDSLFAAQREAREGRWDWPQRLSTEYRSTVAEIAALTGLDFGNLGDYDVFARESGESIDGGRQVIVSPEALFPRRSSGDSVGFGRFDSIGGFLERWEEAVRTSSAAKDADEAGEGAERRRRRRQPRPQPRQRAVVEMEAVVGRVFADDLSGAMHQQFTIVPTKWVSGDAEAKAQVEALIAEEGEVRVAVRFGDSRGLADRIPGLRSRVELQIKGEWISARDAFDVGGEDIPVLHFTHDPLGWICTPLECFS